MASGPGAECSSHKSRDGSEQEHDDEEQPIPWAHLESGLPNPWTHLDALDWLDNG